MLTIESNRQHFIERLSEAKWYLQNGFMTHAENRLSGMLHESHMPKDLFDIGCRVLNWLKPLNHRQNAIRELEKIVK